MLGLILQALFSRVWTAIQGLASFARANPALAVIIALCALSGWLWHQNGKHIAERDAARARIAEMTAAAKTIAAQSERIAKATKELAHEADSQADRTVTVYRDRVMRLPAAPRGSCPAAENHDTGGADEAGASADVLVSRADALICADNTARLEAARVWALGLQGVQDDATSTPTH